MNQDWYDFKDIKRRDFSRAVWIPLRAIHTPIKEGKYGLVGYKSEIFQCTSVAFFNDDLEASKKMNWDSMGLMRSHGSYYEDGNYYPSDQFNEDIYTEGTLVGTNLVIEQELNSVDGTVWHLNQDLVTALNLLREGDVWIRPEEDYEEVVKLTRNSENRPVLIEIKSKFLKDYLCARNMNLTLCSYRSRSTVEKDRSKIDWKEDYPSEVDGLSKWDGRISEIHEGGNLFGGSMAVFHVSRTDVDPEEEVPILPHPTEGEFESNSFTKKFEGQKLFYIEGEFRRTEIIEMGNESPRVKKEDNEVSIEYIVEGSGEKLKSKELRDSGRWLWFKPEVISSLLAKRNSKLEWYTAKTGSITANPHSMRVVFGINSLGLVNVYAKDISYQSEWEQQIWSSYNIVPDGGVSKELQDSQVHADPANTQAPESFLLKGLEQLNYLSDKLFNFQLVRDHEQLVDIAKKTHRFRVTNQNELYALAKDVARLTADSFNTSEVHKLIELKKGEKPGSLKSVERLLAISVGDEKAREIMGPLVGAYELRHGDAHLPGSDIDNYLELVAVKKEMPLVEQGFYLLASCVNSIYQILGVLESRGE
ncbi:hypothetical protein [Halobacteriovorax sp. DPLXC-1]|uniref:hypothetical protein n=1 Tax=Halobacteriovorax sp. DPLXC-1 TaxID=3110771 RepID=UPI002FF3DCF9